MSDSEPQKRVTLTDVGRKAGYHFSTIGYALRDHHSIPEKTKDKIRKIADEMGYRPDPALSSLIAYRKNRQKSAYRTTIAIISDSDEGPDGWRRPGLRHPASVEYWNGMQERAEALGYQLLEVTVHSDRRNQKRVDKILLARGIAAVVLVPMENTKDPIRLSWNRLSAIALGHSLHSPSLPRISHQHRRGTQTAVRKLYDRGYRRIAFVTPYEYDERVDHAWSSGFFGTCNMLGIETQCSHYMPRDTSAAWKEDFNSWLEATRPEVVLTTLNHMDDLLRDFGYNIPGEMGLAVLDVAGTVSGPSGINQNSHVVGRESISLISSLYINNIRGIPDNDYIHQVRGFWVDGYSTRSLTPVAANAS